MINCTTYYRAMRHDRSYFAKLALQRMFRDRIFNLGGSFWAMESAEIFTKLKIGDIVVKLEGEQFVRVLSDYKYEKLIEELMSKKCG